MKLQAEREAEELKKEQEFIKRLIKMYTDRKKNAENKKD